MNIPLYLVLLIYGIAVIGFVVFFVINIYHLVATGTFTFAATVVTTIVICLSMAILLLTIYAVRDVEWGRAVTVGALGGALPGSYF